MWRLFGNNNSVYVQNGTSVACNEYHGYDVCVNSSNRTIRRRRRHRNFIEKYAERLLNDEQLCRCGAYVLNGSGHVLRAYVYPAPQVHVAAPVVHHFVTAPPPPPPPPPPTLRIEVNQYHHLPAGPGMYQLPMTTTVVNPPAPAPYSPARITAPPQVLALPAPAPRVPTPTRTTSTQPSRTTTPARSPYTPAPASQNEPKWETYPPRSPYTPQRDAAPSSSSFYAPQREEAPRVPPPRPAAPPPSSYDAYYSDKPPGSHSPPPPYSP